MGLDLGMTLIDTAEMYGDGGAERVVGDAIAADRDRVFVVSKVYPHNASAKGTIAACDRSLARLRTDRIDLYLLHWRGRHPARGDGRRIRAPARRRQDRALGRVELRRRRHGRAACASRWQSLRGESGSVQPVAARRGVQLRERCARNAIVIMAYSPFQQGELLRNRKLATLAASLGMTAAQLAIAWLLAQSGTIAIPQSSNVDHVREFRAAADIRLSEDALKMIDAAFPPPRSARPLAML